MSPTDLTPDVRTVGTDRSTIEELFLERGFPRRDFLRYCSYLAGLLALPRVPFASRIADALATSTRLPVIWLNGQDCNGNIESFLRASNPTPGDLILDTLSIDYLELLMAPAGATAEQNRADRVAKGGYVLVVEGSIPTGAYCTIGGRAFVDIVKEASRNALAVIAVGTCASHGGLPGARGGLTGARSVRDVLGTGGPPLIALPGCPMNADNLTATIVHYLTFKQWPARDNLGRPLFAYGAEIHERCPRLSHFEEGQFVRRWGDEGHRKGWCLRLMGCQGPETEANCPIKKFNSGTSWPVGAGAVCMGCVRPGFWDVPGGFYKRRPPDD